MTDPIDIPVTREEFLKDAIADQEALLLVIDGAGDFFAAAGFDLSGVTDIAHTKAAEARAALDASTPTTNTINTEREQHHEEV